MTRPNKKWFLSDLHVGHRAVIEYENRPFSGLEEMHAELIKRWNNVVGSEDHVYVIGDFSFLPNDETKEFVDQLNGTLHLIRGNHDPSDNSPFKVGFASVYEQAVLRLAKDVEVLLCHYPYCGKSEKDKARRPHKLPVDNGKWLIHGHCHSRWKYRLEERMINVSVEVTNYTPMSSDKILDVIRKAEG